MSKQAIEVPLNYAQLRAVETLHDNKGLMHWSGNDQEHPPGVYLGHASWNGITLRFVASRQLQGVSSTGVWVTVMLDRDGVPISVEGPHATRAAVLEEARSTLGYVASVGALRVVEGR